MGCKTILKAGISIYPIVPNFQFVSFEFEDVNFLQRQQTERATCAVISGSSNHASPLRLYIKQAQRHPAHKLLNIMLCWQCGTVKQQA